MNDLTPYLVISTTLFSLGIFRRFDTAKRHKHIDGY